MIFVYWAINPISTRYWDLESSEINALHAERVQAAANI